MYMYVYKYIYIYIYIYTNTHNHICRVRYHARDIQYMTVQYKDGAQCMTKASFCILNTIVWRTILYTRNLLGWLRLGWLKIFLIHLTQLKSP